MQNESEVRAMANNLRHVSDEEGEPWLAEIADQLEALLAERQTIADAERDRAAAWLSAGGHLPPSSTLRVILSHAARALSANEHRSADDGL